MKKIALGALMISAAIMLVSCRDERPPNIVFSLDDVPGRYIGALYGTPSARLADELGTARAYYSGEELINGLMAGSVDCAVMESVLANELVNGESGVRILSDTLLEYELRFAVPRENAELLAVVNSTLATLNTNGTLRGLRDKYFSGSNYTYSPPKDVEPHPGSLTLAISPDSPPYSYKDGDEYTGLDVEVAEAICDILGVELRIIEEDPDELVTSVWFGRAELAAGWLPDDVDGQVSISEPYANTAHVILVRK